MIAFYQDVDEPLIDIQDPGIAQGIVLVDTAAGTWSNGGSLYLPETPLIGARILIKDRTGQAGTKSIVIHGNGNNIDGQLTLTLQNPFEAALLAYTGTQWVVI